MIWGKVAKLWQLALLVWLTASALGRVVASLFCTGLILYCMVVRVETSLFMFLFDPLAMF